jgi:two-component system nitrate/nitrite response regulator NarL
MLTDHSPRYQTLDGNDQKDPTTRVHFCGRPLIRGGLEQILEGTGLFLADEPAFGPREPLACQDQIRELFIIDEKFCPSTMIDMIADLKAMNAEARLVLLTDHIDADTVLTARRAGVDGICLASSAPEVLVRSMQLVMLGEVVVSSDLILAVMATPAHEPEEPAEIDPVTEVIFGPAQKKLLSNRETQVLSWLKEGAPNKVIARKLNVAEATVKVHVKAILKKIGVGNRAQAAIWAAHNMELKPAEL